jgi:hypothetical protein
MMTTDRGHTLTDVARLVRHYPDGAQAEILRFALALPPALVSPFYDVVRAVDAALDDERHERVQVAQLRAAIEDRGPGRRLAPAPYVACAPVWLRPAGALYATS